MNYIIAPQQTHIMIVYCLAPNKMNNLPSKCQIHKFSLFFILVLVFICLFYIMCISEMHFSLKFVNETRELKERDKWQKFLDEIDLAKQIPPEFDKFIYTGKMNGGLGNQMYRFASLYAMGYAVNRTPVYIHDELKMRTIHDEMENTFPEFHKRIYFLKSDLNVKAEPISMGQGCCLFKEPVKLLTTNNNQSFAVELLGVPNFENHKYFHHMRAEIRKFFEFHSNLVKEANVLKKQKFGDDTHKLCLHIRAGDFKGMDMGESQSVQIGPAIEYVKRVLPRIKKNANVSLLMFGSDMDFLQKIHLLKNDSLKTIYHIIELNLSRGEELCVASIACDSFLITAPFSSFAFWMAYLMPDNVPIFVIRKKIGIEPWDSLVELPPDWMQIDENWLTELNKMDKI